MSAKFIIYAICNHNIILKMKIQYLHICSKLDPQLNDLHCLCRKINSHFYSCSLYEESGA